MSQKEKNKHFTSKQNLNSYITINALVCSGFCRTYVDFLNEIESSMSPFYVCGGINILYVKSVLQIHTLQAHFIQRDF